MVGTRAAPRAHRRASHAALLAVLAVGCSHTMSLLPRRPEPRQAAAMRCDFEVTQVRATRALLEVSARCDGAATRAFAATEPRIVPYLSAIVTPEGQPLSPTNDVFWLAPGEPAAIRYRVDLDALAAEAEDFDVALRIGGSVVAPASSFLLAPHPGTQLTDVHVRVHVQPGERFATGLERSGDGYRLSAHEIRASTYTVLGRFGSERFTLPGRSSLAPATSHADAESEIEIVTLDEPLRLGRSTLRDWIRDSAHAVAAFWHGFPVKRAVIVLVPRAEREGVLFGKVVPAGGATIALDLGAQSTRADLYRDWILVHELFHLGVPSFARSGKWIDEGLATYFEPIIRVRAGLLDEGLLWRDFFYGMQLGVAAVARGGLERASNFRQVYWGGALVCLLADLDARERSDGRLGLEDGLRAVLADGGDATTVWGLDEYVGAVDLALGAPIVGGLTHTHVAEGAEVAVDAVFASLGVRIDGEDVSLDDEAPRAGTRRSLLFPPGLARLPVSP